jgi:hypothetical protein
VIVPAVYVHCGFGLLLTAMSIPLVLRRVPMNGIYGIRIPESFTSDACWYDINAYGGRLSLTYGILLTVLGYLARDLAPPMRSLWSPVFIVGPLLGMLALVPLIVSYARRRVRETR